MYYPSTFDSKKALELAKLVILAYRQLEFYRDPAAYKKTYGAEWKLPAEYTLVSTVVYNNWQLGFGSENDGPTLVDLEIEEAELEKPVSYDIVSDVKDVLTNQDYPMGFVATSNDGKNAYLIFRGTVTKQEFIKDAKIVLTPYTQAKFGYVAVGFLEVYRACRESFIEKLAGLFTPTLNLYIGGHSLGAALSVLSLPDVVKTTQFKKPTLYNFGCPRVGDNDFVTAYNAVPAKKSYRIVNSSDLVPTLPPPAPIYYSHVDVPVEFNVQKNDVSINHSMDTYLAALGG